MRDYMVALELVIRPPAMTETRGPLVFHDLISARHPLRLTLEVVLVNLAFLIS